MRLPYFLVRWIYGKKQVTPATMPKVLTVEEVRKGLKGFNLGPQGRFYMDGAVVEAERMSVVTWKVRGPWSQEFEVNHEDFTKYFRKL